MWGCVEPGLPASVAHVCPTLAQGLHQHGTLSFTTGGVHTDPCVREHRVSQGLGTQQSPQAWAGAPLLPRGDGLHTEASRPRLCPAWNSLPELFLAVAVGVFGQPGGRAKRHSSLHLRASVCPACSWLWAFSGQQSTVPVQGFCWSREGGGNWGPTWPHLPLPVLSLVVGDGQSARYRLWLSALTS